MKLETIKTKMLEWTDFYGGDLPDKEAIRNATTKEELATILENHRRNMEAMLADAHAHLDEFKRYMGLSL